MKHSDTLVHRLAQSLEQSLDPFLLENNRLASLSTEVTAVKNPTPRHTLMPSVWLDFVPNTGVKVKVAPQRGQDSGLRIKLDSMGTSPWFTMSYDLSISALREGRHFGQLVGCSGDGPVRIRSCLRYLLPEGFRDVYARNIVVLTNGRAEELMFMPIDPDLAREAHGAQAFLFFEARTFDINLTAIEALLV